MQAIAVSLTQRMIDFVATDMHASVVFGHGF